MWKLELQYFGHLMRRADSFEKTLMLGKIEGRRRRGQKRMAHPGEPGAGVDLRGRGVTSSPSCLAEGEMVGWHHQLNRHEFK